MLVGVRPLHTPPDEPYRVDAVDGRGPQPGVDLTDNSSLLDLVEGR